jgi:hypothetical protein
MANTIMRSTAVNKFTFSVTSHLDRNPAYFCGDNNGNQTLAEEARLIAKVCEFADPLE